MSDSVKTPTKYPHLSQAVGVDCDIYNNENSFSLSPEYIRHVLRFDPEQEVSQNVNGDIENIANSVSDEKQSEQIMGKIIYESNIPLKEDGQLYNGSSNANNYLNVPNSLYREYSPSPPAPIQWLKYAEIRQRKNNKISIDQNIQTEGVWNADLQSWFINTDNLEYYSTDNHPSFSWVTNIWNIAWFLVSVFVLIYISYEIPYFTIIENQHQNQANDRNFTLNEMNESHENLVNYESNEQNVSSNASKDIANDIIPALVSSVVEKAFQSLVQNTDIQIPVANDFDQQLKEYMHALWDMDINWIKSAHFDQSMNRNDLRNTALNGRESSEVLNPGDCTEFKHTSNLNGRQSMIDLELRVPIFVTAFEYLHVNKQILSEKYWRTSPKDFKIYGANELHAFGDYAYGEISMTDTFISLMVDGVNNRLEFNHSSIAIPLHSEHRINVVRVVFGNWGANETCVYRMRIRGHEKEIVYDENSGIS